MVNFLSRSFVARFIAQKVTVLAVLALVALTSPAWADKELETVRIAYTDFPPIEYQNEQGEPAGHFVELTQRVAQEAGYEVEFVYLPVSRIYLYLQSGAVDMWPGLSGIPMLDGNVLESWVSAFPVQLSAWYLETSEPLTHFDQLEGKTVIAIGGYTYGGLLSWLKTSNRVNLTQAPNNRAALEMLKLKRGDYVLDYREPVENILDPTADSMIRGTDIRSRHSAWLFSMASPRAAQLRDDFDEAYLRLFRKGEALPIQEFKAGAFIPGFPEQYR